MSNQIQNTQEVHNRSDLHKVTPSGYNVYDVQSGISGETYKVVISHDHTWATCNCKWGTTRGRMTGWKSACAHAQSVFEFIANQDGRTVSAWNNPDAASRQHRPTIKIGDGVTLTSRKVFEKPRKSEAQLLVELGF